MGIRIVNLGRGEWLHKFGFFLLTPTLLRWSPLSAAQRGELRKEGYIILVGTNIFIWDLLFLLVNWQQKGS